MDCYCNRIDKAKAELIREFEKIKVVDSHEHLIPESERIKRDVDVFILFSQYTEYDLKSAGMAKNSYDALFDKSIPIESRWKLFEPYWNRIKYGSYARAVLITAKRIYGFDDINGDNYRELSAAIKNYNKPGIYKRVLEDICGIDTVLIQRKTHEVDNPLFVPVVEMPFAYGYVTWESITRLASGFGDAIKTLDDYTDAMEDFISTCKKNSAVGLKIIAFPNEEINRQEAEVVFNKLRNGEYSVLPYKNPLKDFLVEHMLKLASQYELTVAVHTGYWWDFRLMDPLHMIPFIQRHPNTRFDIFHLGYPWVRETIMLAKGFPNVWLNMCWNHIISQRCAADALDEALDAVPMNKIIVFGGDYENPVEKVYGHLVLARENAAAVLAKRIIDDRINETQAIHIAEKWFRDNAKELYRL